MSKNYCLQVASDQDHDDLIVEMYHKDKYIGCVSTENEWPNFDVEMEMVSVGGKSKRVVPFDEFIEMLLAARSRQIELGPRRQIELDPDE